MPPTFRFTIKSSAISSETIKKIYKSEKTPAKVFTSKASPSGQLSGHKKFLNSWKSEPSPEPLPGPTWMSHHLDHMQSSLSQFNKCDKFRIKLITKSSKWPSWILSIWLALKESESQELKASDSLNVKKSTSVSVVSGWSLQHSLKINIRNTFLTEILFSLDFSQTVSEAIARPPCSPWFRPLQKHSSKVFPPWNLPTEPKVSKINLPSMKTWTKRPWLENMKHNLENWEGNSNKKTKSSSISQSSFNLKRKKNKLNKTKKMWWKHYSKGRMSFSRKDKKRKFWKKRSRLSTRNWFTLEELPSKRF